MKAHWLIFAGVCLAAAPLTADEPEPSPEATHQQGSEKLSGEQDELAADVQQLAIEQTVPKVIQLLKECEDLMAEASERLLDHDTGGETISAQTEVIEKIYAAAKARQQQGGGSPSGSAMLDMMSLMMGNSPGDRPGEKPGGAGEQGGQGMTGDSTAANTGAAGANDGKQEERKIPKAAGTAGKGLPEEFRRALDAYNRGAEKLPK